MATESDAGDGVRDPGWRLRECRSPIDKLR